RARAASGPRCACQGGGGQPRPPTHPRHRVRCVEIGTPNPPQSGSQPMVLNQVTESHRLRDLAKLVSDMTGAEVANLPNPRREADENDLVVKNDQFLALGLNPTTLSQGLMDEVTQVANKYKHRVDPTKIIARSVWRKGMQTSEDFLTEIPEGK